LHPFSGEAARGGTARRSGAQEAAGPDGCRDPHRTASRRAAGNGAGLMIFRRVTSSPNGARKKLSPSFLASIGVHVVVAVALMRMLILNADFSTAPKPQNAAQERVGYVRLAKPGEKPTPGQAGGDGRPLVSRATHAAATP